MHNAVVTNGALQAGQSVLIQGASSGVGLMALQIAKLKGAKTVIGSSTDTYRRGRLGEFGADLAVDSSDPGWVDQVLKATNGEGVDLIVDQVSGKVANQNLRPPKSRAASSMSAGSAAPAPSSISTCTPRAGSLYRRYLPHPLDRGNPRDFRRGPQGYLAGGGIPQTATADRQGVCVRRYRQGL
jgi:NADPH:quinone reductase and related Zn-dependent oxidoreductases